MSARSLSRIALILLALLGATSTAWGQVVSFLYDDNVNGVQREENARRWAFERMGLVTRGDWAGNDQGWFDYYGSNALADVWYVPQNIDPLKLADKMRLYQRGVVVEGTAFDDEFGFATNDGQLSTSANITLTGLHPVTAGIGVGNCSIWAAPGPLGQLQGTPAAGFTALGTENGLTALGVVDTGGALANTVRSNSVATARRVRLPIGGAATDWNQITTQGLRLVEDALDWAANYTPPSNGRTIVMVVDESGSLNDQERWRLRRLRTWGYTVVTLWDGSSQSAYDAAVASAQGVYVCSTCDDSEVGHKLRGATIGVVTEHAQLDTEMGYSTSDGFHSNAGWIFVTDRTHPVSSSFQYGGSSASYWLFHQYNYTTNNWDGDSNEPLARLQGTPAAGLRVLGTQWGSTLLAIVEPGGTLANTHSGNSTAAGRRVRMPWGGNAVDIRGVLSWADGSRLLYDALYWATGTNSGQLIAHYRLDETSGTTAADSSGKGYNGTYNGGPTMGIAPAPRGLAVNFDANTERVAVPTNADFRNLGASGRDFSVAFWMRPKAVTHNDWRALLMIGAGASQNDSTDRVPLIMMHPTNRRVHAWVQTTSISNGGEGRWTSEEFPNDKWAHLVLVKYGQQIRWYVNGQFDGSNLMQGQSIASPGGHLYIGRHTWWGRPDADLDDVRVYNYGLTDDEVTRLHADLVAHFKLNETTGTVANDSSVFKNHATLAGNPVWATSDQSLTLDGTGDYASAPSAPQYAVDGEVSLTAWIKIADSNQNRYMRIVSRKTSWDNANGYELEYNPSLNRLTFGGRDRQQLCATSLDLDSRWRHVAATMVPVGNGKHLVRMYVDGVEVTSNIVAYSANPTTMSASNFDSLNPNSIPLYLGANGSAGDQFNGGLRDVRVYRRALTAQEVYEIGGNGLQLHLKLDETSGTVATDSSHFGSNGTYRNGVALGSDAIHSTGASFDGVDDYVAVPVNVSETAYSSALWFKTTRANQGLYAITDAEPGDGDIDRHLWLTGSGQLAVRTWSDETITSSKTNLNDGRWHHVAHTVGTGGQKLYVDGVLAASGSKALSNFNWQTRVVVGCTVTGEAANQYFAGDVDDVRVYSKTLTAGEVAQLHGLVGHWKLDETNSDIKANDETVFNQDGDYYGGAQRGQPGPYPGAVATSANFPKGAYVDIPTAEHLEVGKDNADFSVAFWLKNNADSTGQWREVVKKHWDGWTRTFAMWLYPNSNRLHCRISTDQNRNDGADPVSQFPVGVWRHVSYVKEGNQLRVFVDGVLEATQTLSGRTISNTGSIYLGYRWAGYTAADSSIDDFRVYSRALRNWEVAELHGNIGRWRLNESSGTVATDMTGMARHGTYMGSPVRGATGPDTGLVATTFDGVDDWVQLPSMQVNTSDGFSMSAWARPTASPSWARILELGSGANTNNLLFGRFGTTRNLNVTGHINSSASRLNASNAIHDQVWRHYAASVTGAGQAALYVNGVLVASGPITVPPSGMRTMNAIAESNWAPDGLFQGDLHDVRLYNRALSAGEARALYYGEANPGLRITSWVEMPNP